MSTIPVQLTKRILRSGIPSLCCLGHPCHRLCRIANTVFQTHLAQQILGIHISKLRRFFQIGNRHPHILIRTGSGVKHLTEAVLQFIIVAIFFQTIKSGKGGFETLIGYSGIHRRTDTITIHLGKLVIRIGISLIGREGIEAECFCIILHNTLTTVMQTAKRILGVFMIFLYSLLKP